MEWARANLGRGGGGRGEGKIEASRVLAALSTASLLGVIRLAYIDTRDRTRSISSTSLRLPTHDPRYDLQSRHDLLILPPLADHLQPQRRSRKRIRGII